jgi:hypothetical protein
MSHIAIAKIHDGEQASFLEEIKALTNEIRDRAFGLFQKRGERGGSAMADWLQAERDLTCSTESTWWKKIRRSSFGWRFRASAKRILR